MHIKRNVVVIVTDGMAVVVSLALINSLEVSGKNTEDIKVVVIGAGAFGLVCWMPE